MDGEYELEYFGFTAEQLSLERKYFLQKIIRNALDEMVRKFSVSEKSSEILQNTKDEVFENIWISMKEEIEHLCKLDSKYFTIPEHVLLPSYFDHVKSYTADDEQECDARLDVLKKSYLENSTMLALLKLENSQYKNISTFVENEVKIQQQLRESFYHVNVDNIIELDHKNKLLTNNKSA